MYKHELISNSQKSPYAAPPPPHIKNITIELKVLHKCDTPRNVYSITKGVDFDKLEILTSESEI